MLLYFFGNKLARKSKGYVLYQGGEEIKSDYSVVKLKNIRTKKGAVK